MKQTRMDNQATRNSAFKNCPSQKDAIGYQEQPSNTICGLEVPNPLPASSSDLRFFLNVRLTHLFMQRHDRMFILSMEYL